MATMMEPNMLRKSFGNNLKKSMTASQIVYNTEIIRISPDIAENLKKHNPELVQMFKAYLLEQLEGDYVELWLALDNFKQDAFITKNRADLLATAQAIYDKYWGASSEYQIAIKPKVKDNLTERMEAQDVDANIFDEAASQLEQESYKKFLRSDVYASFMADRGSFVRTSSPKRRVSITELFKKKGERRSSLASFSATQVSLDDDDEHDFRGINPHNIDLSRSIDVLPMHWYNWIVPTANKPLVFYCTIIIYSVI